MGNSHHFRNNSDPRTAPPLILFVCCVLCSFLFPLNSTENCSLVYFCCSFLHSHRATRSSPEKTSIRCVHCAWVDAPESNKHPKNMLWPEAARATLTLFITSACIRHQPTLIHKQAGNNRQQRCSLTPTRSEVKRRPTVAFTCETT